MASSSLIGTTQNLKESGTEALQALFNSISPEDASRPGEKLSSDQVKKISDKLEELLGDQDVGELIGNQKRNEKGELLNEEGLPIIDIVEPVKEDPAAPGQPAPVAPPLIFDDPDLLPHWALSPAEKARRKAERERILDLLEEEERIEKERNQEEARERWRAELEKRKEAAKAELESLRKARDLQKKMGKALLRNVIESSEREDKEKEQEAKEWQEQKVQETVKVKKSVSFADELGAANEEASGGKSKQWGDIALARLRKGKAPLLTRAQIDNQPMKMDVVERHPVGVRMELPPQNIEADSDDESVPGSPVPADSDEGEVIRSDADSEDLKHDPPLSDSDATDVEQMSDGGEPVAWQEEDFDYAQHQREVALAYYEKRATIGMEAYSAMRAHSHDEDANEWDQPDVPLDATLASPQPKPSTSRFKNQRATEKSSATLASHSLGPSVLPSSQTSNLKKAVRMGKLANGQLVGDGSDEDDVTEEARAIIELLSRGEITNVGPQPNVASNARTRTDPPSQSIASTSTDSPEEPPVTAKPRLKVSRFKLNLAQAGGRDSSPPISPSFPTPQMTSDRSSPKLSSPSPTSPTLVPTPTSRQRAGRLHVADVDIPESIRRKAARGPMLSMIVESPSFRPPSGAQMPGTNVDSPSFRPPASSATSTPSMPPMIVDSPAFPPPASTRMVTQSSGFQSFVLGSSSQDATPAQPSRTAAPRTMPTTMRPAEAATRRPGVVIAAEVRESTPPPHRGEVAEQGKAERVSKFKAERM